MPGNPRIVHVRPLTLVMMSGLYTVPAAPSPRPSESVMSAALQKPSSTFARVLSSTIGCVSELDGPPATGLGVPDEEDVEDEALVVGLAAGCAEPPEPLPPPVRTTAST